MKLRHLFISLLGLGALFFSKVNSLPRLALDQSTACKSCHINPAGGGMRTEFGSHAVAFSERTLPQTKKFFKGKYRSPRISEALLVGFDLRYLVLKDGTILRMQTDAFADFQPYENFDYFVRFWENGVNENFAMLSLADKKYWLKLGRFAPSFGLHNADHTSFNRERLGYAANVYLDGIGLGVDVSGVQLTTELFNPNGRSTGNINLTKFGYAAPVSYMLGGSLRFSEKIDGSTGAFRPAKSIYGGLAYDRLNLLSEVDFVGDHSDTLIFYSALTGRIEYGLHLIAEYNFFDGDRDLTNGVDEFYRFSVEFFPIPFFQLRPSYTRYTKGFRENENDYFLQFYVGY